MIDSVSPAAVAVPPLRVIVTTFEATETLSEPPIVIELAAVVPPELNVNPPASDVGNVATIFPFAGIPFTVLNVSVTSPAAESTAHAGSTFVPVRTPAVIVSAATAAS